MTINEMEVEFKKEKLNMQREGECYVLTLYTHREGKFTVAEELFDEELELIDKVRDSKEIYEAMGFMVTRSMSTEWPLAHGEEVRVLDQTIIDRDGTVIDQLWIVKKM